jgi:integrase
MQKDIAARTRASYETLLRRHLIPTLGNRLLQQLRADELSARYAAMRDAGLSKVTVLHLHRAVSKCLKDARRHRLVSANAADDALRPKVEDEVDLSQLPAPERVQQFLADLAQPVDREKRRWRMTASNRQFVRDLTALALDTGLRRSELLALRWGDIDFATGAITVARSVEDVGGLKTKSTKSGKVRKVAVPVEVVDELRAMLARQKATWLELGVRPSSEAAALLLPASPDQPEALLKPAAASKRFHEAATACGLPDLTLHDLRHLHCSALLAVLPLPDVSKRLGHANPAVTARLYAHALPGTEERQAAAVAELRRKRSA